MGTWPHWMNAVWNGSATYLFILMCLFIVNPVLISKLSLVRNFLKSHLWRPLSTITFASAQVQGLVIIVIYASQEQKLYFGTNLFWIFLVALFLSGVIGFFNCLLFELPFQLLFKVVICPPRRSFKLNKTLERQLNPLGGEEIFYDALDQPKLEDPDDLEKITGS
eukprot:CAMPEP_0202978826 /NCGR_PEP_ID=MMETSP1396-20130829/85145_1 /ASSEMBLY_ACC=CAM_ASM_000872 /TAXON_ID= /ORGANISM="Pseudokeronopsis sp., Strain Brazil" /LENGTH=164 /DNA_ID=CAMNT_0049717973 /DNA_START=1133 /DNA_END=1627 /DNA_ORIENTATION=+